MREVSDQKDSMIFHPLKKWYELLIKWRGQADSADELWSKPGSREPEAADNVGLYLQLILLPLNDEGSNEKYGYSVKLRYNV